MKRPSSFLSRKAIVVAITVALVGGAAAWSIASRGASKPTAAPQAASAPAAVPVSVATVVEKPVTEWDDFSGRIEAIERVEIRPRVPGTIDAVHFQEGQLVKKGDLLFTIDPRPYQAELARAEAALAGATARLSLAKTELERTRRLIEEHAVAQRELDQRENALREADASLKAAEAAVQTARLNLQYTAIAAPIGGRVSRAEITVGNLVGAGSAVAPLTTIVSVSPVFVSFEIDERTYIRYAAKGAAGNSGVERIPVSLGLANEDGYPHRGRLKAFDNRLDTTSGTIRVRAVFDNPHGVLTPGMYARVRTGGATEASAILIEDKAVGTDQDKKFVMVVDGENKVRYRPVTLGPVVDGLRVVRSGLAKDERVVVSGLQRVRPNDAVTPMPVALGGEGATAAPRMAAARTAAASRTAAQ
jgi:multidrug efflux system membrane fusion protein